MVNILWNCTGFSKIVSRENKQEKKLNELIYKVNLVYT